MEFDVLYHPEVLGGIYEQVDGVRYAEPSWTFGDGSDISRDQVSTYTFKRGWGDCLSGCISADYWLFSVNGGSVELIAHYGSSVSAVAPDLAGLGSSILGIAPNPFNSSTTIKYRLNQEGWVRLSIFDLRGRPILELVNEHVDPGEREVSWRGVDRVGAPVASGLYSCRLVVGGVAQVREMTLLK